MADYPVLRYSNNQVKKAGKALAGDLLWMPEREAEIVEAFRIAYNWRDSHAYPMRKFRYQLIGKIKRAKNPGITAARTKRMASIRKKLRRSTTQLVQMQDLGGCRAIMASIEGVAALLDIYRADVAHKILDDRSYIESPKGGGYRSHHFVFQFKATSDDEAAHDGRRIEVQIRSGLQHAWATAVEAVGLVRGEDMKAGRGDPDWLRLFELVSSEFAEVEGCPAVPGAPEKAARIAELTSLDRKLNAVTTLENLNQAFRYTQEYVTAGTKYFLIQYDNEARTVKVRGYADLLRGAEQYGMEERSEGARTTVLVEADKIDGLMEAYPNYFLDVRLFAQNMAKAIAGQKLDTILRSQEEGGAEVRERGGALTRTHDLSWWFKHRGRFGGG